MKRPRTRACLISAAVVSLVVTTFNGPAHSDFYQISPAENAVATPAMTYHFQPAGQRLRPRRNAWADPPPR